MFFTMIIIIIKKQKHLIFDELEMNVNHLLEINGFSRLIVTKNLLQSDE